MKKTFAIALILFLVCSAALADSLPEFVARWNRAAFLYGAPQISESDAIPDVEDCWQFKGEGWYFRICFYNGVLFDSYARTETTDAFLTISTTLCDAIAVQRTPEELTRFKADVLENYLCMIHNIPTTRSSIGIFNYYFEKDDVVFWTNFEEK